MFPYYVDRSSNRRKLLVWVLWDEMHDVFLKSNVLAAIMPAIYISTCIKKSLGFPLMALQLLSLKCWMTTSVSILPSYVERTCCLRLAWPLIGTSSPCVLMRHAKQSLSVSRWDRMSVIHRVSFNQALSY